MARKSRLEARGLATGLKKSRLVVCVMLLAALMLSSFDVPGRAQASRPVIGADVGGMAAGNVAGPAQMHGPVSATAPTATRHVTAGGSGDCGSWATACDLQAALSVATSGDEIWVVAGVYTPGTYITSTFVLTEGIALYGGFAGTESARNERNWATNVTVLSGDIDSNDWNTDTNNIAESWLDIVGDNAEHVVSSGYTAINAVLDGFTITAGKNTGSGGGLFYDEGNPTLANLVFSGNQSDSGGGLSQPRRRLER